MKNKNQTKENWIEKIKCKRENHENQLCGGCEDCQAFWGLKSLIESILKSEKAKDRQRLLKKIEKIIDDNNDLLRWQKEELKEEIKKE